MADSGKDYFLLEGLFDEEIQLNNRLQSPRFLHEMFGAVPPLISKHTALLSLHGVLLCISADIHLQYIKRLKYSQNTSEL